MQIRKEYFARPHGAHFHNKKDCPILQDGDFEKLKYREIGFSAATKRHLRPCTCATIFDKGEKNAK